jgi:Tfp pilus assembly protein PilF
MALADTGRLVEALEHYTAGLAMRPDSTECLNNSGVALARLGRLDEAATRFEQCLAISPNDRGARENLEMARALIAAGNRSPD